MLRVFDTNWGESGKTLGVRVRQLISGSMSEVLARTTSGVSEQPSGSCTYEIVVDVDPTKQGRILWDDGENFATEIFLPINSGNGSGPNTITLVIRDNLNNLIPDLQVTVEYGANKFVQISDTNGQVQFSLPSGTYKISIFGSGYQFTPTTLVVTSSATIPLVVNSLIIIIPDNLEANQTLGWTYTRTGQGYLDDLVPITFQLLEAGSDVDVFDTTPFIILSQATSAKLEVPLYKGSKYQARTQRATNWVRFTTSNDDMYRLPSVLGEF